MSAWIKKRLVELRQELVGLRRDFHQYPEIGFEEFRTRQKIKDYLETLGIKTREIAKTGIVGHFEGGQEGRTILLRADIDALPVQEETALPFRSVYDGLMHACGHDGHIAMLLIAAKVLMDMKADISGNIKFAFQPNEEDAGAWLMIEEGVMENPRVDAAFGCHLWSLTDTGTIDIQAGPVMAASHYFYLTVTGKGGHAGFVQDSIDPIFVASSIIQAAQAIQTREIDALHPVVIMFTKIMAGANCTIVPEQVKLEGSIRFLNEGGEEIRNRFERIVKSTCEAHRAAYKLEFKIGNHLLSNDEKMTAIVQHAAEKVLEDKSRVTSRQRTMAGEDFSEYAIMAPAAFAFVGTKNRTKGSHFPHHHPKFDIDEDSLSLGAELYIRTALEYLNASS